MSTWLVRTWVMIQAVKTKLLGSQVCTNVSKIRDSAKRKTQRVSLINQRSGNVIKRNLDWPKLKVGIRSSSQETSTNQQKVRVMYSKQEPMSLTHTSNLIQACLTVAPKNKQSKPSLELCPTEKSWIKDLAVFWLEQPSRIRSELIRD